MIKNGNETFQSAWPKHLFTNEIKRFCAGMIDPLGLQTNASNFHDKVFSFLLLVYFGTSLLLFYNCVLWFSS